MLLLLACAPRVVLDPFAEQRAALAAIGPAPDGWAPEATVVLGGPLVDRLVLDASRASMARIPEEWPVAGLPGTDLRLRPKVEVVEVRVRGSTRCESCIEVEMSLRGTIGARASWTLGTVEGQGRWSGRAVGVARLAVEGGPDGRRVVARAADAEAWELDLALDGLPVALNALAGSFIEANLEQAVGRAALPAVPLARLREDGPVHLRDLRVRPAAGGVAVDLSFRVLGAGAVSALPDPGDGWAVVAPAATLLALARAGSVDQYPMDGHVAEPTSLDLGSGGFTLGLRTWRVQGRLASRDYRVSGDVELDAEGRVHLVPRDAEAVSSRAWALDPVAMIVDRHVLDRLGSSLDVAVPTRASVPAGPGRLELVAGRVVAEGDVLELYGGAEWR